MKTRSRLSLALVALAAACVLPRAAAAQADAAEAPAEAGRLSPAYTQNRTQVLTVHADSLAWEGRRPRVWGAIMEMETPSGGMATLVVFADGTTSLYSSAGGGIVGVGQQRGVRGLSDAFLRQAGRANGGLEDATGAEYPHPESGRVRFYLRTSTGVRTAEAGEAELRAGRHPLSALFTAGHAVLDEIRPRRAATP
jgi:hypothetical protein